MFLPEIIVDMVSAFASENACNRIQQANMAMVAGLHTCLAHSQDPATYARILAARAAANSAADEFSLTFGDAEVCGHSLQVSLTHPRNLHLGRNGDSHKEHFLVAPTAKARAHAWR